MKDLSYAIGSCGELTIRRNGVSGVEFYTPFANSFGMNFASEVVYAMANGARAVQFNYNKTGEVSIGMEVFSPKLLAIMFGGDTGFVDGTTEVFATELPVSAEATTIELADTPLAGSLSVYVLEADNVGLGSEIEAGDPSTEALEYSISGTTITVNAAQTGVNLGIFYVKDSATTASKYSIKSSEYGGSFTIDLVTAMKTKYNGVIQPVNIVCKNSQVRTEGELNFEGGAVASFTVTFDIFDDDNGNMADIIVLLAE